jgi:hypothetical protein
MNTTFSQIIDRVYRLPLEDKIELASLLERNISEQRRSDIHRNYLIARKEEKHKQLIFSSDIENLKSLL